MSIKYVYDDSRWIDNYLPVGSKDKACGLKSSPTFVSSYAYTDAVRNRPYPRFFLTPTPLQYVQREEDQIEPLPCGPQGLSDKVINYRAGSHAFSHAKADLPLSTWQKYDFDTTGSNVANQAIANGTRAVLNMGENLGTLNETGKMVARRARQIMRGVDYLRSRDWRGVDSVWKIQMPSSIRSLIGRGQWADAYLELQFGWKPILQDAFSAVEAYDTYLARGSGIRAGRSRFGTFDPTRSPGENVVGGGAVERIVRHGGSSSAAVYVPFSSGGRQLGSLGLGNPALIAWELQPLSFVADWFYDVSTVLQLLTYGIPGLLGGIVCKTTEKGSFTIVRCGRAIEFKRTVTRSVTPLIGAFSFAPSPRSPGVFHVATAAALLEQRFR